VEKMAIFVDCGNFLEHGFVGNTGPGILYWYLSQPQKKKKKKKIDPCRTRSHYLKFGTLQHNTVFIDATCGSTAQIGNFTVVSIRYQYTKGAAQESCTGTQKKRCQSLNM